MDTRVRAGEDKETRWWGKSDCAIKMLRRGVGEAEKTNFTIRKKGDGRASAGGWAERLSKNAGGVAETRGLAEPPDGSKLRRHRQHEES